MFVNSIAKEAGLKRANDILENIGKYELCSRSRFIIEMHFAMFFVYSFLLLLLYCMIFQVSKYDEIRQNCLQGVTPEKF